MSEFRGETTDWSPELEERELEKRADWVSRAAKLTAQFDRPVPGQVPAGHVSGTDKIRVLYLMPEVRDRLEETGIETISDLSQVDQSRLAEILYHNETAVNQVIEQLSYAGFSLPDS